jgi:hypothetical protein
MPKKLITATYKTHRLVSYFEATPSEIIEKMENVGSEIEWPDEWHNLHFEFDNYYLHYNIVGERLETDKEYEKRLKAEAKTRKANKTKRERKEARERKQYEKLHKIYGERTDG